MVMLVKGRPRYRYLRPLPSLLFASAPRALGGEWAAACLILRVENKIRSEGTSDSEECAGLAKHLAKFNVREKEESVQK